MCLTKQRPPTSLNELYKSLTPSCKTYRISLTIQNAVSQYKSSWKLPYLCKAFINYATLVHDHGKMWFGF